MKRLLIVLLCIISYTSIAQSVEIIKHQDEMTGKVTYLPSYKFIVANEEETTGFTIQPYIKDLIIEHFIVKSVNIGSCVEKDELIILFEDGQTITKRSWNDFNCTGTSYFRLSLEDTNLLSTLSISKIRFTNGRTHDRYTGDIKDSKYFISLYESLKNMK